MRDDQSLVWPHLTGRMKEGRQWILSLGLGLEPVHFLGKRIKEIDWPQILRGEVSPTVDFLIRTVFYRDHSSAASRKSSAKPNGGSARSKARHDLENADPSFVKAVG